MLFAQHHSNPGMLLIPFRTWQMNWKGENLKIANAWHLIIIFILLGHSSQKLLFANVPSTVYPTIQSIFQQEDNEVVNALSPAYRELPSTHFSYVGSFNASITGCCENETTLMPNSTEISVQPHTSSLSSEQLNLSNESEQNTNNTVSNSASINMTSTSEDTTILERSLSQTNLERINDSSQSIHIIRELEHTQQMSTKNGIITDADETVQSDIGENTMKVIEPAIHNDQLNEAAMNNEPVMTKGQSEEPEVNDQGLNETAINDQRLCAEIYGATSRIAGKKTKQNVNESVRGASSFGVVELSPKARAFSPDYYALTFRREGSGLSDVSCSSLRGASALAASYQRSPVTTSVVHERGASVFGGEICEKLHPEDSFIVTGTREPPIQSELLKLTHESLPRHKRPEVVRSCTEKESEDEPSSCTQSTNVSPGQSHSVAEIPVNSVQISTHADISAVTTINQRPNSYPTTKANNTNDGLGERKASTRSSLLNDRRNNYNDKFPTPETHKTCEVRPMSLTESHTTPNLKQHETLHQPITTRSRQNIAPITIPACTSRDKSLKKAELNTTYQSLRGASQLGRLGDDDDDEDSDRDAFWESVSLSFAYESPSEEDV